MFRTNVGETIKEVVAGIRSPRTGHPFGLRGPKVLDTAVLAMDYRWTPEQMLEVEVGEPGRRALRPVRPSLCDHASRPPRTGDDRDWRDLMQLELASPSKGSSLTSRLVSEGLRSQLDGREACGLEGRSAALSTEMSFDRGGLRRLHWLSHAARGLPIETQKKLLRREDQACPGGRLVAAKRGPQRALRSKAAMIDDDLRRETAPRPPSRRSASGSVARIALGIAIPRVSSIAYSLWRSAAPPGRRRDASPSFRSSKAIFFKLLALRSVPFTDGLHALPGPSRKDAGGRIREFARDFDHTLGSGFSRAHAAFRCIC